MRWMMSLVCMSILFHTSAQNKTNITLVSDRPDGAQVSIDFGSIQMKEVETELGKAFSIQVDQGTPLLNNGAPDLPQVSFSLLIPNLAKAKLEIVDAHYTDYTNVLVAPSRGKIFRNQKPSTIPFVYGEQYRQNEMYPSQTLDQGEPYTLRDYNGVSIHAYPAQYNPVTKTLRVFQSITMSIKYEGQLNTVKPTMVDESFDLIYRRHFINYAANKTRYSPITQQGKMLIVTPGMYLTTLKPFIDWKKQKGIDVLVANTDTLSGGVNETNLRNLAKWYYQSKQIAYMLLVGDHTQIPAVSSSVTWVNASYGPCSDLTNAYISNNDHYPEFMVGRFSGESLTDVATQVERTIAYEKYPNTSSNWFQNQIGIASDQGDADSDDGQIDYEHICEILDSNKNQYNYVNSKGFFDGTQSLCNDDAGNPDPSLIAYQVNNGVGLINYCGHGSLSNWTTSGFSNSDVDNLNNINTLPFIFSTACSNGYFMSQTCFGEAWLRARTSDGKPKGALATIMSSIVQDWNPPMEGQDEMNAVLRGARSNNKRTTFGAIVTSGFMAGNDKYNTFADPDGGNAITDTWIIFGDPSVEVRTKNEGIITCSHHGYIQQNSTMFFVGCPVEGATITMYYQGELIASSVVSGGTAILYCNPVAVLDSILITATKQNWTPYQAKVDVVNYAVGTSQVSQDGVALFPNPAHDQLFLHLDNKTTWNSYLISDLSGRILQQGSLTSNQTSISLISLAQGSYIMKLMGQNRNQTIRFSKK